MSWIGYGMLHGGILIHWNVCASILEVGTQCISSARWDLYGGCRVIGIPTVILRVVIC